MKYIFIVLLLGLMIFFPQNNLLADEKPTISKAEIIELTTELVDRLAEIAKEHGLEVSDEQKKALLDQFIEENYKALSELYNLID